MEGSFALLLNSASSHEDVGRIGGIAPPFLTSVLNGGEK
jgi:hypothetical protein